ncbi:unnamed protein product, partial [Staurois parvus]
MLNGGVKETKWEKREDVINKKTEDERKKRKQRKKNIFWEISGVKCSPCSTGTSIM